MSLSRSTLAAMLHEQPLFMSATGEQLARNVLGEMASLEVDAYFDSGTMLAEGKPYRMTKDGLAIIPIEGMLLHKLDLHYPGWFTGYGYIESLLDMAMADDSVKGVVFDITSPGGMVSGCFELCDYIYSLRDKKPMLAVVDGGAYSAAYAIASSVNVISASRSSGVGSIGVITMHVDMSQMLENWGVKVTMLYKGAQKADGNPYQALTPEVRARIEASLEKSYTAFVDLVSKHRGISAEDVRATEAATFDAAEGLALGLVDAVAPRREAVASFVRELSGSKLGGSFMSAETEPTVTPGAGELNAIAPEAAVAAARTEAAAAERTRINGIMGCEEAKGRESLANHFAFNTSLSVEDAKAALAAAPVQAAAAAEPAEEKNPLEAAMAAVEQPEVGAAGGAQEKQMSAVDRILADFAAATGHKFH